MNMKRKKKEELEKARREKEKKENRKILLYAILTVASFIAVSFGTAYAFYTATIIGNRENGEVQIKTANVLAVFNNDKDLVAENVLPGFSDTLEFSIVNVSPTENTYGNYTIVWEINENSINSKDFVYTLTGETYVNGKKVGNDIARNKVVNIGSTIVPNISDVLGTGMINTGVTHKYVMRITFRESGLNQNELQDKKLYSYITVKGEPVIYKENQD